MNQENESTKEAKGLKRSKKFMVFTLGEDRFAIPLYQVKEVIGLIKITPIPDVPKYFKGLINLRGRIISTLDLRSKLGIPVKDVAVKKSCIIISELNEVLIGTIVDNVSEVVSIEDSHIERQLDISSKVSREYITGIAKIEGKPLTILLDIGKVLDVAELASLRKHEPLLQAA